MVLYNFAIGAMIYFGMYIAIYNILSCDLSVVTYSCVYSEHNMLIASGMHMEHFLLYPIPEDVNPSPCVAATGMYANFM